MIGLVTYAKAPTLTDDDRPLLDALRKQGLSATPVMWDDPAVRWGDFHTLVLRSCWDYHLRAREFAAWLDVIERAGVRLWNPYSVVRWNMHKGYLRDLERRGARVVPTRFLGAGDRSTLAEVIAATGWPDAIVKPAISASATDTWRTTGNGAADHARFSELVARADVLVQPTIPEVASRGEWSVMIIDGAFSHGVIKRPKAGDFRVQTELGGSAEPAEPPSSVVSAAMHIASLVPEPCLFLRIDGVETETGFTLMEVEALEPLLFFAFAPPAVAAMARAIARAAAQR
jgi:glutathione synthase/RimK-type ligase-like ATP-grasp enzyme